MSASDGDPDYAVHNVRHEAHLALHELLSAPTGERGLYAAVAGSEFGVSMPDQAATLATSDGVALTAAGRA